MASRLSARSGMSDTPEARADNEADDAPALGTAPASNVVQLTTMLTNLSGGDRVERFAEQLRISALGTYEFEDPAQRMRLMVRRK
jgi:hypothetical protein